MTGRTFTTSLKPAWTTEKIEQLGKQLVGMATFYAINHDKDYDPITKELIEAHTHIYLDYKTPRKLTTIANLLEVEPNFIEIVRNKKAMTRYLVHLDDQDKYQYDYSEVYTNEPIDFAQVIAGGSMTNTDILEKIYEGKTLDLLDIVPIHKLSAIQKLAHYEQNNRLSKQINEMHKDITEVKDNLLYIHKLADNLAKLVNPTIEALQGGFTRIAEAIETATKQANIKRAIKR